jgi:hypothetical protein
MSLIQLLVRAFGCAAFVASSGVVAVLRLGPRQVDAIFVVAETPGVAVSAWANVAGTTLGGAIVAVLAAGLGRRGVVALATQLEQGRRLRNARGVLSRLQRRLNGLRAQREGIVARRRALRAEMDAVELVARQPAAQRGTARRRLGELWSAARLARGLRFALPIGLVIGLVPLVLLSFGCTAPPARSGAVVVVWDVASAERSPQGKARDPQAVMVAIKEVATQIRWPAGTSIEVVLAGRSGAATSVYRARAPARWEEGIEVEVQKAKSIDAITSAIAGLVPPQGFTLGSDVPYATWMAGEKLAQTGATDRYLVILSDLRAWPQPDSECCWYRRPNWVVPDRDTLLTELARLQQLPDLAGVHVMACGIHAEPVAAQPWSWDAARAAALHNTFTSLLEAAGAASIQLTEHCDALQVPQLR